MAVRTILTWPNPGLKDVAKPVEIIDASIMRLAQDLRDTMCVEFGIGLAATQVGLDCSIAVIRSSFRADSPFRIDPIVDDCIVLVNPKIELLGEDTFRWTEACLSVPGIEEIVERHRNIRLTYTDLTKETHTVELDNEIAGLVQHEVDHLFGKLFVDRLKSKHRRQALNTLRSSIRTAALARVKEERRAKREELEEQEGEEVKPGFRPKSTSNITKHRKRPAKKFGKNKHRRK